MLPMELPGILTDQFGACACHLARCIWKDQDEFIAPIAAGNILSANMFEQQAAQFMQDSISHGMSPGVIEQFKIIHVQHNNAQGELFP